MTRIDKALEARLKTAPDAPARVIVRTAPHASEYASVLEAEGLRVVRVSSLINAVTVEGPARAILSLSNKPWVVGLEPDGTVHTMGKQ